MRLQEQIVRCPICGRPYKVYAFYSGDQSACGACRAAANEAARRPDSPEEVARRNRAFNPGGWRRGYTLLEAVTAVLLVCVAAVAATVAFVALHFIRLHWLCPP